MSWDWYTSQMISEETWGAKGASIFFIETLECLSKAGDIPTPSNEELKNIANSFQNDESMTETLHYGVTFGGKMYCLRDRIFSSNDVVTPHASFFTVGGDNLVIAKTNTLLCFGVNTAPNDIPALVRSVIKNADYLKKNGC
ncbi:hypothetical protein ABK040_001925 [Willaertia magna]